MTRLEIIKETRDATTAIGDLGARLITVKDDPESVDEMFNEFNLARIDNEADERLSASNIDIETDEDGNVTPEAVTEFIIEAAGIYVTACIKVLCGQAILDYLNEEVE